MQILSSNLKLVILKIKKIAFELKRSKNGKITFLRSLFRIFIHELDVFVYFITSFK